MIPDGITVPTWWTESPRQRGPAVRGVGPDIPMSLSSEDFFAGRDPVLDAALEGLTAP